MPRHGEGYHPFLPKLQTGLGFGKELGGRNGEGRAGKRW